MAILRMRLPGMLHGARQRHPETHRHCFGFAIHPRCAGRCASCTLWSWSTADMNGRPASRNGNCVHWINASGPCFPNASKCHLCKLTNMNVSCTICCGETEPASYSVRLSGPHGIYPMSDEPATLNSSFCSCLEYFLELSYKYSLEIQSSEVKAHGFITNFRILGRALWSGAFDAVPLDFVTSSISIGDAMPSNMLHKQEI